MAEERFNIGATEWPGISKLMEEAAEVIQVCAKLMATDGEPDHWDGSDLRERLQEEMADVLAAIDFVTRHNTTIDGIAVATRRLTKLETFEKWHRGEG